MSKFKDRLKKGKKQMNAERDKSVYLKRDPAIEFARILGCLIVIGVHTWWGTSIDYANDFSRNFISCILADGVAIFWLITGAFLFRNYMYEKVMFRTLKSIIVPMAVFSAAVFFVVNDMLAGTFTFIGVFQKGDEIQTALFTLLKWQNPVSNCGHLWYLYIYIFLMVISPALFGLVKWMEEKPSREYGFLTCTAMLFIVNDITGNAYWGGRRKSGERLSGLYRGAVGTYSLSPSRRFR